MLIKSEIWRSGYNVVTTFFMGLISLIFEEMATAFLERWQRFLSSVGWIGSLPRILVEFEGMDLGPAHNPVAEGIDVFINV